jgi:glutathione S-transferase
LIGDFSAADIMLGHSCVMSGRLGLIDDQMPHLQAYVARLNARPALVEALAT